MTSRTRPTPSVPRRRSSFFSPSPPPPKAGEKEFLEFDNDTHHFSMIRNLHAADYITLLNGYCGFNSIVSCLRFVMSGYTQHHYLVRAMAFVPLGLFFDFMDGRVARWRKKSSLMGQELDSLADLVSFGVAPAIIAFTIGMQTTVDAVVLTIFVMCGLTRLARFNVTVANIPKDKGGKAKYFEGTPIPTTLVLVGLMFYAAHTSQIHQDLLGGVILDGTLLAFHPLVLLFLLSGSAMISKSLKIPKI